MPVTRIDVYKRQTIDIVNRQVEFMEMLEENIVDGLIACVDPIPGFSGRNGKAIVSMDRDLSLIHILRAKE